LLNRFKLGYEVSQVAQDLGVRMSPVELSIDSIDNLFQMPAHPRESFIPKLLIGNWRSIRRFESKGFG
jgi:hypothetical protein